MQNKALHYFKVSFRELIKYKTQSVVSIIGLAIGFTAFVLGGYWMWWETHFDNFHPNGDRLYCLTTTGLNKTASGADADLDQLHINDLAELKKLLPEIETVCTFVNYHANAKINNNTERIHGMICDHTFFDLFRADFINGTYKGTFPNGESVVLTENLAKKLFGTTSCVGQIFDLGDERKPVVAGVIKNYPDNSDLLFQFLLIDKVKPLNVKRNTTYIRLQAGTDVDKVKAKLATYKSHADNPWGDQQVDKWKINLRTPSEVHLYCHPELESRIRNIRILSLAGLMAFLSALMNLLVLFIGQQQRKQQKNRTYLCIGASTKDMLMKGWVELFLPMFIAYLLAFCLIEVVFPYYESYTAWNRYGAYAGVSRQIDRSALFGNAIIALAISTFIFGMFSLLPIRRIFISRNTNPAILKRGLIIGQVFIGSLFFITSLILFQQLNYILTKDKGIDYQHVIQVDMGYENAFRQDIRALEPELRNHPFIEDICYTGSNSAIFTEQGNWYGSMNIHLSFDPEETDFYRSNPLMLVSDNFFSFFRLGLKDGKWLDESTPGSYMVNESGFRELGFTDMLERPIYQFDGKNYHATNQRVTGIIKDYIFAPMQYPVLGVFFRILTDEDVKVEYTPAQYYYIRYQPEHKKEVLEHIRNVTQKMTPDRTSVNNLCTELSDLVDKYNQPEKVIFSVFSIIAILCILISTFGIYSLVSLSTQQRKKEIAIRKVNGATFSHILQLFFKEYLILVVISNLFALPVGYILMKRWLETYANHISLTVWPFIVVFCITCIIVLLSIFRQVKTAAEANPAESVKSE